MVRVADVIQAGSNNVSQSRSSAELSKSPDLCDGDVSHMPKHMLMSFLPSRCPAEDPETGAAEGSRSRGRTCRRWDAAQESCPHHRPNQSHPPAQRNDRWPPHGSPSPAELR